MEIELTKEEYSKFSKAELKVLGWTDRTPSYHSGRVSLDVMVLTVSEMELLKGKDISKKAKSIINLCLKAMTGDSAVATNAETMTTLLSCHIAKHAPGFRVFRNIGGRWFAYFVDSIQFIPEERRSDYTSPARVRMQLEYNSLGKVERHSVDFYSGNCRGRKPATLLAQEDFHVESPEILAEYLAGRDAYLNLLGQVGLQCKTNGIGFGFNRHENGFRLDEQTNLDIRGASVKVVIDVPCDDEDSPINRKAYTVSNLSVSNRQLERLKHQLLTRNMPELAPSDDEDTVEELEDMEAWTAEQTLANEYELAPIHPVIPVFDLTRHDRYGVHALDLHVYEYDTSIGDKLILPDEHKKLLKLLTKSDGNEFRDIVEGKSGGTTVLLAGRPGLGKTLSAEAFSEATSRPLYRVQCSQLGTDPNEIEGTLTAVFGRAVRWKAIILLDEADLYISKRGTDMQRNAIVCVFLRVLEYQSSVLFLTTNMPDTVDDAIASRCIARIDMVHPTRDALVEIYTVLAKSSGSKISLTTIEQMAKEYPKMGGRDVKQAIKLARVYNSSGPITAEALQFVLAFHPNRGDWL